VKRLGRRLVVVATAVVAATAFDAAVASAHGIGGRADLPVPVSYFAVGAGIAIVGSFVLLSALWTEPRLQGGSWTGIGRRTRARRLVAALRAIGVASLVLVVLGGLVDGDASPLNIAPVLVFVYFWLVVPFASAAAGNLWRWMSPWAALSRRLNAHRPEREGLLATIGIWPAVVALIAFTWLELVSPTGAEPRTLAIAALLYTAFVVGAGYLAGPESGLRLADAFHTYNGLISRIAPIDIVPADKVGTAVATAEVGIVRRRWLSALPTLPEWPGLATFVIAMIATVSYDGASGTELWASLTGDVRRETWFETLSLLGFIAAIGVAYGAASWAAARLAGSGWTARRVAARFAHTLVPIALAYAVAHYITLVLYEGQLLIVTASDPFGLGWNLFGTAEWDVRFFLSPEVVWYLQVMAIVAGHIAGVVLAHDRALADFGGEVAVRTQYAMLALMVALTSLGLFILAG
jgi:hypothetical protein